MNDIQRTFSGEKNLNPAIPHLGWWKVNSLRRGSLAAHSHPECFEFCYIKSGELIWWAGDNIYELKGNDLYMTWPGEIHGGMDDILNICEIYWVQFNFEIAIPGLMADEQERLLNILKNISHRTAIANPKIAEIFAQLISVCQEENDFAAIHVRSLSCQLLLEFITCFQNAKPQQARRIHSDRINKTLQHIHQNFCYDIAIDDLAAMCQLSSTAFRQSFKEETGMKPLAYINHQRIKKAKYLLCETKKPISLIAMDCGFQTSQYFATVFKRLTAMTPAEFRHTKI